MTLRDHLGPRTPENAALHDELDKLLAARAVALGEAGERMDNGHSYIAGNAIRALATTDSTAALDRVIRAHVEKALEMAGKEITLRRRLLHRQFETLDIRTDDAVYAICEDAIHTIAADDVLREMGGRGNG